MGGGKSGISQSTQDAEVAIAQQEMGNAQKLFDTSYPGFQEAESYYQQLASGDPTAIARANAPATEQINQQATATKERISQDMPRGGEKNLALEENEINKGAQIGGNATKGYLSSFQNLSGLAGQGISQSSGLYGQAGSQYSTIANQQAEGKSQSLGFYTALAGTAAEAGGAMCWIAEAIFGVDALETGMVRRYLLRYATRNWVGRLFVQLYIRHGQKIAERMETSPRLKVAFRPLFHWLFRRARLVMPEEEQREIFDEYWRRSRLRLTPAEVGTIADQVLGAQVTNAS